jgi:hypothetical protein
MKDQKEDYLVANLKYILESSGMQHDSADLDASIKNKKDEIEDVCSRNMNAMISHYQKYYTLKKRQRDLQAKVEQFNLKIQNFKRLENYSTQEIDAMAKNITHIDEVLTRIRQYKVQIMRHRVLLSWRNVLSSRSKIRSIQIVSASSIR